MNKGTVKFFNATKGFGFIKDDENGQEYFVHVSGLVEKVEQDSFIEIEKTQYSIRVLSFYKTLKYSPPTPPPEFI